MKELGEQCRNRWRSILPMFGIGTEYLSGKHGPCPICEGKDRFRFDDKDGKGGFFCNQCGAGDGVKLVMLKTGMSFAEAAVDIRDRLGETSITAAPKRTDAEKALKDALALWGRALPICQGDEADRYLATRGIGSVMTNELRFCSSAPITDHPSRRTMPALLGLVTGPDGRTVNVHRTYLENGRKADIASPRRMMPGEVPPGSAIRLAGIRNGALGVAEGIETAIAAGRQFKVPCWSVIDAGKMAKFTIPDGVSEFHIFGDNDPGFAGQAAAFLLAQRASAKLGPANVHVHIPGLSCDPTAVGADWADIKKLAVAA